MPTTEDYSITIATLAVVTPIQWRNAEASRASKSILRRKAEARSYASDMYLAQQALAANNLRRTVQLLDSHRPGVAVIND